jgi:magnesium transporter
MKAFALREGIFVELEGAQALREAHARREYLWVLLREKSDQIEAHLEDLFGIHALTLEDIWAARELPKVEPFAGYTHILVHGLRKDPVTPTGVATELDVVVGDNYVLLYAESADVEATVFASVRSQMHFVAKGPWWLAHAILDGVVDDYVRALDVWEEALYQLERDVISGGLEPKTVMSRVFAKKRQLRRMRRTGAYQREVLMRLSRGQIEGIPHEIGPYMRDVYDHFARVTEYFDGYRDQLSGLLDAHMSAQSNKMNEVMKALTLMSTVMLPLTFIAGVYGMNFQVMPELSWHYGYPLALALMASTAIAIVYWFYRKGWL